MESTFNISLSYLKMIKLFTMLRNILKLRLT